MLAHADETDDSHAPSRTHPGCAVVPAALAVAESVHASGERLLRAVVLGYDVAARVNYALGADALAAASRSTHSIGGTFGAGAAAGALLRLDVRQVRHLLSFCAQQASGVGCNVRDSEHVEKAFDFGGMPARNGVTAATMVAAGFTAVDDVFSGERNFLEAYGARPDPERLTERLGQHFEIMGTNIKKWSVGSPAQAALDALALLIETERIGPDEIESIDVHLPSRSARTVDNSSMPDVNVQHLMAMLLIDGKLSFEAVHDDMRLRDPAILALRRKIALVPSEELTHATPRRQAIVAVKTRDGRTSVQADSCSSWDGRQSDDPGRNRGKSIRSHRRRSWGAPGQCDSCARCATLETVPDVTALRRLWQPSIKERLWHEARSP